MTHEPNTPRTHNAKGQKVDEPVQCIACLQAWPCEVEVLRRENDALRETLATYQEHDTPAHIYGEETL